MRLTAEYWIKKLHLSTHREGGSFREVYRSPLNIPKQNLPDAFKGDRSFGTSIYYLLARGQFSAFHRIASDEIWHFYFGDPLIIYEIENNGVLIEHLLGVDFEKGQTFQCVIKAGNWYASRPAKNSQYSLVGCTVAPGFDFEDFELADREKLTKLFPQHKMIINELT